MLDYCLHHLDLVRVLATLLECQDKNLIGLPSIGFIGLLYCELHQHDPKDVVVLIPFRFYTILLLFLKLFPVL